MLRVELTCPADTGGTTDSLTGITTLKFDNKSLNVANDIQAAFDLLALNIYYCTRAELMRACIVDCLKRHAQAIQK